MKFIRNFTFLLFSLILFSCSPKNKETIPEEKANNNNIETSSTGSNINTPNKQPRTQSSPVSKTSKRSIVKRSKIGVKRDLDEENSEEKENLKKKKRPRIKTSGHKSDMQGTVDVE